MKCKHGIEGDTCSLCLGYKQSAQERGRDNLVEEFKGGSLLGDDAYRRAKEVYMTYRNANEKYKKGVST